MKEETKNLIKVVGWLILILLVGFELGMLCSKSLINIQQTNNFYNGSIPNTFTFGVDNTTLNYMDKNIIQAEYCTYEYHYTMCKDKPFKNRTGLYCNNTLVCEN